MTRELRPDDLFDVPDPFAASEPAPLPPLDLASLPASPDRGRVQALRLAAVIVALAFEALLVVGIGAREVARLPRAVLGYGVLALLLASPVALLPLRGARARRGAFVAVALLAGAIFVVASLLSAGEGDRSAVAMAECAVAALAMAAGPTVLAVYAMRHAFASGAGWRTGALGLASGLLGAAAIRLHCPDDALAHLLVAHGAPVLLAPLAAALLGARVTRA